MTNKNDTSDAITARSDAYHRNNPGTGEGLSKSLPKLRSFADLKPLKEKLINADGKAALREAGAPHAYRPISAFLQSATDEGHEGNGSQRVDRVPVAVGEGGTPGGRAGDTAHDAQEGAGHDERHAADDHAGGSVHGGAERSNVQGVDLDAHSASWYTSEWLRKQPQGLKFTSGDVLDALGMPFDRGVSSFLTRAHSEGVLKYLGKDHRFYLYELIGDITKVPVQPAPHPRVVTNPGRRGPVHRLDGPGTGRISSNDPPFQFVGQRFEAKISKTPVELMDFSAIEDRAVAHLIDEAQRLPGTIRGLMKELSGVRIELLEQFTTAELLNEVKRRTSK